MKTSFTILNLIFIVTVISGVPTGYNLKRKYDDTYDLQSGDTQSSTYQTRTRKMRIQQDKDADITTDILRNGDYTIVGGYDGAGIAQPSQYQQMPRQQSTESQQGIHYNQGQISQNPLNSFGKYPYHDKASAIHTGEVGQTDQVLDNGKLPKLPEDFSPLVSNNNKNDLFSQMLRLSVALNKDLIPQNSQTTGLSSDNDVDGGSDWIDERYKLQETTPSNPAIVNVEELKGNFDSFSKDIKIQDVDGVKKVLKTRDYIRPAAFLPPERVFQKYNDVYDMKRLDRIIMYFRDFYQTQYHFDSLYNIAVRTSIYCGAEFNDIMSVKKYGRLKGFKGQYKSSYNRARILHYYLGVIIKSVKLGQDLDTDDLNSSDKYYLNEIYLRVLTEILHELSTKKRIICK